MVELSSLRPRKSHPHWGHVCYIVFGRGLAVLAGTLAFLSVMLAAGLKTDLIANFALKHYPRYQLAIQGWKSLQATDHIPANPSIGQPAMDVGVIDITQPCWPVFWDFIQSEIAFRKSERFDPTPNPNLITDEVQKRIVEIKRTTPISFGRIKSIMASRQDGMTMGTHPITPPYNLYVVWPATVGRSVYDFISFEELRMDLRGMIVGEIEAWSLYLAAIGMVLQLPAGLVRALYDRRRRQGQPITD